MSIFCPGDGASRSSTRSAPAGPELRERLQLDRDVRAGHPELMQLAFQGGRERGNAPVPLPADNLGAFAELCAIPVDLLRQLGQPLVGGRERRRAAMRRR